MSLEMSHTVQMNSFWGAMSPQGSLFKTQDGVPCGVVRHGVHPQPSSGCFHHCQHTVLALAGLQQCDAIDMPALPIFLFWPLSLIPQGLHLLGLPDCSTRFTVTIILGYSVHG